MAKSDLEKYKAYVSTRLIYLSPFLQNYALGDFSESIDIPEEEDEFTELLVGLTLMVDDLKEMIQEREDTIAKLVQAEHALHESESNFRAIAENAYDGILIGVGKGIHVYANERMAEITGYSVPELLETSIKELAHPDELPKIAARFKQRLAGEPVPAQYETVIVHKDGQSVPVELTASKSVWQGQAADIVIVRDITERKLAEDELSQTVTELERTNAELERFNRMAVGREHRMIELKRKINALTEELGRETPYELAFAGDP